MIHARLSTYVQMCTECSEVIKVCVFEVFSVEVVMIATAPLEQLKSKSNCSLAHSCLSSLGARLLSVC